MSRDPFAISTEYPGRDRSEAGNRARMRVTTTCHWSQRGILRCVVRFRLRAGLRACQAGFVSCRGTCCSKSMSFMGDRVLVLIIVMLTLVSRTIAPSLPRFPTLSRSGLAFKRTMSEFKQVRTQKRGKTGDAHGSFRRHRTSELDFSVTKHPAIVHDLVVQVARYPRAYRDCR